MSTARTRTKCPLLTLTVGLAALACPAYSNAATVGPLPADAPMPLSAPGSLPAETVQKVPAAAPWRAENTGSFLYFGINRGQLSAQTLAFDTYTADFGSQGYSYPSLDFFSRILTFANPASYSALRDFSLWSRVSVGFATRGAHLQNSQAPAGSGSANDSLSVLSSRIGPVITYGRWSWVKPYAGVELAPYLYQNTSDNASVRQQTGALSWGPVAGVHLPVLLGGRASFFAEYHRTIPIAANGQIYGNADNVSAGAGLAF